MYPQSKIFIIPSKNRSSSSKIGRTNKPVFIGDKVNFANHKKSRLEDLKQIIEATATSKPIVSLPDGQVIFEIEFHKKSISKSAQPRKLLLDNNIDVYAQKTETKFFASSTEANLRSFKESIKVMDLLINENDSAYLSAITHIQPIATKDKIDSDFNLNEPFKGFLFFPDTLSVEDCRKIANGINHLGENVNFIVTESGAKTVHGIFPASLIRDLSLPDPRIPIQKIEKSATFLLPQTFSFLYQFSEIKVMEPMLDSIVAIVDSGVKNHTLYNNLIVGTVDCINDPSNEDLKHGTFVATRAMFGNDIEDQIKMNTSLQAKVRILDIKVIKKDIGASDKEIIDSLNITLNDQQYEHIKIFNLSLSDEKGLHDVVAGKKSYLTRELDALAYKYKVIFIVAAGNHKVYLFNGRKYPECLFDNDASLLPPADLINGISVGSIADVASSKSVALNNEPSSFTRVGLVGIKKPELTHFGGNVDKYGSPAGIGVKGFSTNLNHIDEDVGTSLSAPLVSQIAAQIYAYILETKQDNPIDLTKALLLHSAVYELPQESKIPKEELYRITGFGVPDFAKSFDCAESAATFIYCDSIGTLLKREHSNARETKHRIKFNVPEELSGKDKKVKIRGTLVYTPPISSSGDIDYSLVDIEINLHHLNSKGKPTSSGLGKDPNDYRNKWNPVRYFEREFNAYESGDWEVWLTLTTRGVLDGKDYSQPYALVLTLEDTTLVKENKVNLFEIIKAKHQEYALLEAKAKVRI